MSSKPSSSEAAIGEPLLRRILSLAGRDMVLVGGQALAFWAAHYGVAEPQSAITKDADFLGTRADVKRLAAGIGGTMEFPHERALTALMGQVRKHLPGDDYVNIDVMFRVYGDVTAEAIRARAVTAEVDGVAFKVMHPLDVLQGRLENLYGLPEKQDEHGLAQLILAIEMVQRFLGHEEAQSSKPMARAGGAVLKHIGRIEQMARSDAGRKVARRFGVHVADAIHVAGMTGVASFMTRKLPQLLELMSTQRRAELADSSAL